MAMATALSQPSSPTMLRLGTGPQTMRVRPHTQSRKRPMTTVERRTPGSTRCRPGTAFPTSAEEWKLVTVLCCALAEPPLRASRELEPHYSALRALAALMQDTVQRYGGTMQPVVGEQLLAVFGAPL